MGVKLGYAILFAVTTFLYFYHLSTSADTSVYVGIALICMLVVSMVLLVSMIEGLHAPWQLSFAFSFVISLMSTIFAVRATFDWPERELELWLGTSVGLLSVLASAARVLALFFWKQTIMTAYTRGTIDKRGCICIYLA